MATPPIDPTSVLTGQFNAQQQQQPAPSQQPDQLEVLKQRLAQQATPPSQQPSSGVKGLLQNFFQGFGNAAMHEAGLPTPYERQQKALSDLNTITNTQAMQQLHQASMAQFQPVPLVGLDQKPILGPDGKVITLPAGHAQTFYAGQAAAAARLGAAQETAEHKTITVPGVGAFAWDQTQGKYAPVSGAQVPQHILQPGEQEKYGFPAGTTSVPESVYSQAVGAATKPLTTVQGENDQYQFNRLTGKKTPIGVGNPRVAAVQARAALTPFDTVIPGTNQPTTISVAQALKQGAPHIPEAAAAKLGGQYALFNDAYGLLDKINSSVGTGPGQVNLEDPTVRARVTAGYAALKDPAAKGLAGEVLSNYLARQPLNDSLKPEEREFILSMAQGKAAATGLRSILGQAGSNEMQQRLDSAMFPGAQAAGSNQSIKQQSAAMRGLLDRVSVGQVQAGLNAPGTSTALPGNKGKPPALIYARDPQGKLHSAPVGTALPKGWTAGR